MEFRTSIFRVVRTVAMIPLDATQLDIFSIDIAFMGLLTFVYRILYANVGIHR